VVAKILAYAASVTGATNPRLPANITIRRWGLIVARLAAVPAGA
jgi:hypothetical protein